MLNFAKFHQGLLYPSICTKLYALIISRDLGYNFWNFWFGGTFVQIYWQVFTMKLVFRHDEMEYAVCPLNIYSSNITVDSIQEL